MKFCFVTQSPASGVFFAGNPGYGLLENMTPSTPKEVLQNQADVSSTSLTSSTPTQTPQSPNLPSNLPTYVNLDPAGRPSSQAAANQRTYSVGSRPPRQISNRTYSDSGSRAGSFSVKTQSTQGSFRNVNHDNYHPTSPGKSINLVVLEEIGNQFVYLSIMAIKLIKIQRKHITHVLVTANI